MIYRYQDQSHYQQDQSHYQLNEVNLSIDDDAYKCVYIGMIGFGFTGRYSTYKLQLQLSYGAKVGGAEVGGAKVGGNRVKLSLITLQIYFKQP